MKKRKHLALAFGLLICFLLFPTSVVSAEEYADSNPDDYITNYFDVNIEFDTAHRAMITETINVTFVQPHHGLTRVIPNALDHNLGRIHEYRHLNYSISSILCLC